MRQDVTCANPRMRASVFAMNPRVRRILLVGSCLWLLVGLVL
jgi:hypothetical protein